MKRTIGLVLAFAFLWIGTAAAYDWEVSGKVTVVEATYMPGSITFQIDSNAGSSCPAGSWLIYRGQGADAASQLENIKAVYALLLSAKLSGSRVNLFGNNANCIVAFVWQV